MKYKQMISRLERVHDVSPAESTAFRARGKNFARLGWPEGVNSGTGKAADWTERRYLELGIAFELNALGITPERAIDTVKANYPALIEAALNGTTATVAVVPPFGSAIPRSRIMVDLSKLREMGAE